MELLKKCHAHFLISHDFTALQTLTSWYCLYIVLFFFNDWKLYVKKCFNPGNQNSYIISWFYCCWIFCYASVSISLVSLSGVSLVLRDTPCGWGVGQPSSEWYTEIKANLEKSSKINENQWKSMIFDDFSGFVMRFCAIHLTWSSLARCDIRH